MLVYARVLKNRWLCNNFLSILCPQKEIRRQYSEKMGSFVQEKVPGFDQVTSKKEEKSEQNSLHVEKHAHLFAEGDNLRMKVDSQFQLIWFASSSGSV